MASDHGTAFPSWYIQFQTAVLHALPKPPLLSQEVGMGWSQNGQALSECLRSELLPSQKKKQPSEIDGRLLLPLPHSVSVIAEDFKDSIGPEVFKRDHLHMVVASSFLESVAGKASSIPLDKLFPGRLASFELKENSYDRYIKLDLPEGHEFDPSLLCVWLYYLAATVSPYRRGDLLAFHKRSFWNWSMKSPAENLFYVPGGVVSMVNGSSTVSSDADAWNISYYDLHTGMHPKGSRVFVLV